MNKKICPVCGNEKKEISLSEYDCEYCGFTDAFVQFFATKEGYERRQQNVKLALEKNKNQKRDSWANSHCLSIGNNAVSFLDASSNTMYIALGNGCVQIEQNAILFSSNERNYAVLYKDGVVKVFGDDNEFGQKNIEEWKNIIHITVAPNCTYGITKDGNIVYAGALMDPTILKWRNLKSIMSSDGFILGVHNDGKISLSAKETTVSEIQNVTQWKNIKDIVLTKTCIVGLLKDGRVKYWGIGDGSRTQCESWKDMIAIAADNAYVYGLTKDGKVLVAGNCKSFLDRGRRNACEWIDVVAISCNKSGVGAITGSGDLLFAGTIAGDEKKIREKWSNQIKQNIKI